MGFVLNQAAEKLGRLAALDPVADGLEGAVHGLFQAGGAAGKVVKNALHGTWLGHPLHPVLVSIPVGAWTVATVLDALGHWGGTAKYETGADAAVTIGLVGAGGAALSGLTDWSEIDGEPRRIGLVHGLLNLAVTGMYAVSLVQRRRGQRAAGRRLGLAAYLLANTSAYLGGHLVEVAAIGVNHAATVQLPPEYTPVLAVAELAEGEPRRVTVGDAPVLLVRAGEKVYALAETCAHLGGPLSEGKLEDGAIECPWHGSRFELATGRVLDGPAAMPQPCFAARIRNGQVEVLGNAE